MLQTIHQKADFLQFLVLPYKSGYINVHYFLDTIGMINDFQFERAISGQKTKSRLESRHRNFGRATKKGISCILLIPLVVCGVPDGI